MTKPNGRDASELNPAAAARRRLLKSLGVGAAAGTIFSVDWTRPVVRLGALPVHAQSSPRVCSLVLQQHLSMASGTGTLQLNLSLEGTEVSSVSTVGGPTLFLELAYDGGSSGSFTPSFQWSLENPSGLTYSVTRSEYCCQSTETISAALSNPSSSDEFSGSGLDVLFDDGTCELSGAVSD